MGSMKDASLDREIERLFTIEPSPAFVARVRTRIAEEPRPSARSFGWLFTGVAAAAVAASVAALVVLHPDRRIEPASHVLVSRLLISPVVVSTPNLERRSSNLEPRTPNLEPRTSNLERPDSSPLFDPRETMALQRLIAGVRYARIDLTPLLQEAPMPPPVDELVIPPLTIEPLAPSGVEGERP